MNIPKKRRPSSPNKDKFLKNIGISLLIFLLVLSIVGLYGRPLQEQEEVGLSRIVQEINQQNIAELEVNQEDITVSLKDSDTKLVARKETGVSVTETLSNLGVDEERLHNLSLTVKKPSGAGYCHNRTQSRLDP